MKILPSFILSFILVGLWTCSDTGYPLSNDCIEDIDCAGVCGGSSLYDTCGICAGDGSTCNISYLSIIQPIINANCTPCHITTTRKDLSLSNYTNIMSGNSDNGPVIVAEDHINSLLWQYVNSGYMPFNDNELTTSQKNLIATWIDEGALNN